MILLKHLISAITWVPWAPVGLMMALTVWALSDLQPDFGSRQLYLRGGFLLAALALSFAFDDPAAPTTISAPSPLRIRRLLRVLVSLVPWAAAVAVLMWVGGNGGLQPAFVLSNAVERPQLPVGRLLLEAGTMATWGLAVASVVSSRWDDEPGKVASTFLLVLYVVTWLVPEQWKPWADPTDSRWITAHHWWWTALILGAAVTVGSSWDARRQRLLQRFKQSRADLDPAVCENPESQAGALDESHAGRK
ncbi:hypothetical protein BH23ACT5_BH23ACT5_11100 [soil metagenome]